jgi:catechol 2,3-dioxygenase-like lactoylglutathione lyase family enzyme
MEQNRRNWLMKIGFAIVGIGLAKFKTFASPAPAMLNKSTERLPKQSINSEDNIKLGAFSVSLNVKDLPASKQFYENLGFIVFGGGLKKNYLVMKNGNVLIGLFYGMFEQTMLTFNPGWDENANRLEKFDDVRAIQRKLKLKGIKLLAEADEKTSGPASMIVLDPDGNQLLFDQHV